MAYAYIKLYTKLSICVYMCKITSLVIVDFFILLMRNKGHSCIRQHKFSLKIIPTKGSPSLCITDHMPFLRQDEEEWGQIHTMIGMFVIKHKPKGLAQSV